MRGKIVRFLSWTPQWFCSKLVRLFDLHSILRTFGQYFNPAAIVGRMSARSTLQIDRFVRP